MWILGLILTAFTLFYPPQDRCILEVEICNIRSRNGMILISIYNSENQYPYHPYRSIPVPKDSLSGGCLHTTIEGLLPGFYGMCVLDDENRSGQLEYSLLGIPTEGFGFSNNVKPFLKRPDYDKIRFRLAPGQNHMQLTIRYK